MLDGQSDRLRVLHRQDRLTRVLEFQTVRLTRVLEVQTYELRRVLDGQTDRQPKRVLDGQADKSARQTERLTDSHEC